MFNHRTAVVVTTFLPRFEMFKATFSSLAAAFPDEPKVVSVDGWEGSEHEQQGYHDSMRQFLEDSGIRSVHSLFYQHTTPLTVRWNEAIRAADSSVDSFFITQDDVAIHPNFGRAYYDALRLTDYLLKFGSFNFFIVKRSCIEDIGWFDEEMTGIGEEDGDYECRIYLAGKEVQVVSSPYIHRIEATPDERFYTNPRLQERWVFNKEYWHTKYEVFAEPEVDTVFVPITGQYVRRREPNDPGTRKDCES